MSAPFSTAPTVDTPPATADGAGAPSRATLPSRIGEILGSLCRLADLQFAIWLARTKMAVLRIVLAALVALLALVVALLAILFLYAGVYHVLTDLLRIPTAWALLIFAGAHALLAGILTLIALAIVHRGGRRETIREASHES